MSELPLATRLRPQVLSDFVGQTHLIGEGKPLHRAYTTSSLHTMILWGPPGVGKTTLAKLLSEKALKPMECVSAVIVGVKEIRDILEKHTIKPIVLFIDEIHRFNKAQQDLFLPLIEQGDIVLIGATTENPSFSLNNALLSRARVYVLKNLEVNDLLLLIQRALEDKEKGFGHLKINFPHDLRQQLAQISDGDARRLLNLVELAVESSDHVENETTVTQEIIHQLLAGSTRRFNKQGDIFHQQISALHKSLRGSDPDAALYWLARMIDGGADPLYIARRMVRAASEDVGNADPRALQLAINAYETIERLGSPEGELSLAQAVVYMSCAPKSNAVYVAWNEALLDAKENGSLDVPLHLCNAPTALLKKLGYGKDYRYAHDEPDGFAEDVHYFPEKMQKKIYYHPKEKQGLEKQISEKLSILRKFKQRACI